MNSILLLTHLQKNLLEPKKNIVLTEKLLVNTFTLLNYTLDVK